MQNSVYTKFQHSPSYVSYKYVKILVNSCVISYLMYHSQKQLNFPVSIGIAFRDNQIPISPRVLLVISHLPCETNKKLININFSSSVIDWILRHDFPSCHELHQYIHKRLLFPSTSYSNDSMMNYFPKLSIRQFWEKSMRFHASFGGGYAVTSYPR